MATSVASLVCVVQCDAQRSGECWKAWMLTGLADHWSHQLILIGQECHQACLNWRFMFRVVSANGYSCNCVANKLHYSILAHCISSYFCLRIRFVHVYRQVTNLQLYILRSQKNSQFAMNGHSQLKLVLQ